MFHRRSRSASVHMPRHGQQPAASGPAATAAVQAFLASRPSSTNLSSAAAAAALRSMSPPPTQVSQVQTRRMLQRQSSNASTGGRPGLERQNSSGSMTERTFRSPSPNHPGSQTTSERAPPIPPVPRNYASSPTLNSERRAAGMEPPPRAMSPTLRNPAGRGASIDNRRVAHPPQKTIARRNSNLADTNELDRTDSRSSTNFSYPLTVRPNSPPPKSSALMQSRWAPGQPLDGISPAKAEAARQGVYDSSQQPVKKKRKKVARGAAEGSHLSSGTTGFRTVVAPQETRSPSRAEPLTSPEEVQETAPVKRNKKKAASYPEGSDVDRRPISPGFSSDSDTTPEKATKRAQRASGILQKQPSIVREDWEGEQGDNMQGVPTTNQRGPAMSLAESPASAVKSTKPSTAANMSRKIDEVAIEPKSLAQNVPSLAVDVPIPTVEMPISSTPQSAAKGYLDVGKSASQGSRQTSLSPSRSKTRFSAKLSSDLATERKHEPLPRSTSPAKSAMKHHSPPAQDASPIEGMVPGAWRRASTTPSEASDNASMASDQGLTPLPKKKRSAQVSFREGAEIVGVSQTAATESPILASPQHKDAAKKGWFGLGKSKSTLGTIPAEDDMEEVMKPRPVLPSFGSVRGKNRSSDVPEQRTPSTTLHDSITLPRSTNGYNNTLMPSSSEASTASPVATDTSASSDHAIGSIIAQESAQNRLPNGIHDKLLRQPLPPVVTSVEGTGYASDTSESIYSEEDMTQHVVEEKPEAINPIVSATNASAASSVPETIKAVENVPTIAVQPATPAIEQTEQTEQDDMYVSLPGGFPVSAETLQSTSQGPSTQQHSSEATPAGLGITEPLPREQVISQQPASPAGTSLSDTLRKRDKEDSDEESTAGDSIYSDAEEDLSYMDGDGFGSINAIVESPLVKPPANRITTPPESPIAQSPPSRITKPTTGSGTESWEQVQAHWSGVTQQRRQDKDQSTDTARQPESEHSQSPKPKTKKKKKHLNISTAEIAPEVLASMEARQTSTAASSGRGAPAAPARTSMRTSTKAEPGVEEPPRFRRSMRPSPSSAAVSEPQIPVEASPGTSKPKGALQKKHIPSTASGLTATEAVDVRAYEKQRITKTTKSQQAIRGPAAPAQTSHPSKPTRFQRTFSNDSDSSSSFRKRRKGIVGSDGKYTMRRSMRDGQSTEVRQTVQPTRPQAADRKGIRSLSPINRRPFSSAGGQPTMRSSMRTSFDASPRTLRNQEGHQRSSSAFAGFGKSKPKSAAGPSSKLKSRFADSDDEDVLSPKIFHSRFEDSSDEEPEPIKFRPVRGIPRRIDEGDSTDLEDSSDVEKQMEKSKAAVAAVNASAENGVIKGGDTLLSLTKEKKSFFGRFRSKKDKEQNPRMSKAALESSVQTQAHLGQARTESERAKSPEIAKSPELERAKSPELSIPKPPSSPAPGVQRRLTPRRVMSDQYTPQRIPTESWPLPLKIESGDGDRPCTADGVANASPPAIAGNEYKSGTLQRHNTASTVRTTGGTPVYSEKTGKKKRFPMLRKVFGLYD